MSWILGVTGKSIPEALIEKIRSISSSPMHTIHRGTELFIIAGGINDTLHYIDDSDGCALIAGCGISINGSSSRILESADWQVILKQQSPPLQNLNGNFTAIRFRNNILECYSDRVGLRTLYFGKLHTWWIFSSRLSLVCRLIPDTKINWNAFGSRWKSFHPLSYESQIVSVERLPPNGYIKIENEILFKQSKPWLSWEKHHSSTADSKNILTTLTTNDTKHIRIGMSGGLDSRTLLAIISSHTKNVSTCTFGNNDEPDIILAKKIATSEDITFHNFSLPFPAPDECIHLLNEYICQTNLVGTASMSVRLRYYPLMKLVNTIHVDGGNGEIARRQFLNRLYVFAYKHIRHLNSLNILPYLMVPRADIFNEETNRIMLKGMTAELNQLIHTLPSSDEIGVANFLDHWAARIHIPNIACDEQARIDEHILNFMPYSQPDFINSVLQVPLKERRNNRLFKKIIADEKPSLSNFPLIKNNIQYPYHLSTMQMRAWIKIQSLIGKAYTDKTQFQFLDSLKIYILDTLCSQSVKDYPYYD